VLTGPAASSLSGSVIWLILVVSVVLPLIYRPYHAPGAFLRGAATTANGFAVSAAKVPREKRREFCS
jgi:hypothetical protein